MSLVKKRVKNRLGPYFYLWQSLLNRGIDKVKIEVWWRSLLVQNKYLNRMIFKYIPYEWDEISYKHQHTLRHQSLWGEAHPWTHRRSYHGKVSASHSATTDGSLTPSFHQSWSCYSLKGEEKDMYLLTSLQNQQECYSVWTRTWFWKSIKSA